MSNKIGIWGFVLSIVGLVLLPLAILFGLIGLILSIIGVVKASKDPSVGYKGLSIAGIIISSISLMLWVLVLPLLFLVGIGILGGIPGIGGASTYNADSSGSYDSIYWETANIGVSGMQMSGSGIDTLILKNNNVVDISISKVILGDKSMVYDENNTILKGQKKEFTGEFGCDGVADFSETLFVEYVDKRTNAVYQFSSDVELEGECTA